MGVGLRLSAASAEELAMPNAFGSLQALLEATETYVFTINGFPYGAFHGTRVKEQVYAPDWATPERRAYTGCLAELLVKLLSPDCNGSISTVPGTFKPWADGRIGRIVDNLIDQAVHLARLAEETGRTVTLALEPEPCCLLETISETVRFFEDHLYSRTAVAGFGKRTGLSGAVAEEALRRHLGVCYDVCHAAVEFEDPSESLDALRSAGIEVSKLQLSSALRIPNVNEDAVRQLSSFDEPTYLHQVVESGVQGMRRYQDLADALSQADRATGTEWRVHFHLPIFLAETEAFSTTQSFLREVLRLHRHRPISPHLEVETYTWEVLPEGYKTGGVSEAIARELQWVRHELSQ